MMDEAREFLLVAKSGLLAAFGGVVGYLVDVTHHGKAFSWIGYAIFVMTAFFVGQVLDSWLPDELPGRGGVLMVAGTAAYPVLLTLQAKVNDLINRMR